MTWQVSTSPAQASTDRMQLKMRSSSFTGTITETCITCSSQRGGSDLAPRSQSSPFQNRFKAGNECLNHLALKRRSNGTIGADRRIYVVNDQFTIHFGVINFPEVQAQLSSERSQLGREIIKLFPRLVIVTGNDRVGPKRAVGELAISKKEPSPDTEETVAPFCEEPLDDKSRVSPDPTRNSLRRVVDRIVVRVDSAGEAARQVVEHRVNQGMPQRPPAAAPIVCSAAEIQFGFDYHGAVRILGLRDKMRCDARFLDRTRVTVDNERIAGGKFPVRGGDVCRIQV